MWHPGLGIWGEAWVKPQRCGREGAGGGGVAGGLLPAVAGPHPAAGRAGGRGLGLRGGRAQPLQAGALRGTDVVRL